MSVSLILTLSLIYLVLLFIAMMYNNLKRRRELFKSSAFVLGMSTIAHLGNYLWLKSLPLEQVLGVAVVECLAPLLENHQPSPKVPTSAQLAAIAQRCEI